MSDKYSGPVLYLCWNCGGFGSLDLAWPPVKSKSSSELVGRNMGPMEGVKSGVIERV